MGYPAAETLTAAPQKMMQVKADDKTVTEAADRAKILFTALNFMTEAFLSGDSLNNCRHFSQHIFSGIFVPPRI